MHKKVSYTTQFLSMLSESVNWLWAASRTKLFTWSILIRMQTQKKKNKNLTNYCG